MRLSDHFDSAEFRSHDGARIPAWTIPGLRKLCREYLEPLRDRFGAVTIISGVRSLEHNRRVGGARASFHLATRDRPGRAADVRCLQGTPRQWFDYLDTLEPGGLGLYPTHVHVDTRRERARW